MKQQLHQRSALARACRTTAVAALALAASASTAHAGHGDQGSLLFYPQFDTRPGRVSILSVTNTSETEHVNVEFVYIGRDVPAANCTEFNRVDNLTPNDTFSTVVDAHNPHVHQEGFVYVVAQSTKAFLTPISFNHLMGSMTILDGLSQHNYELEAIPYFGLTPPGTSTDLDNDGLRDLDGLEYSEAPDSILVPRFIAQSAAQTSELILINLTLTIHAEAVAGFLVYNDNEEVFSTQYNFNCWERTSLSTVSGVFGNDFLSMFTNHDVSEIVGAPGQEAGWMRIRGAFASTSTTVVADPTILAVLIETSGATGTSASLPFSLGQRASGSLVQSNKSALAGGAD